MKPVQLGSFIFIIAALVFAIDFTLGSSGQAALVYNLAVWTAIFHGCIAIVAAAELCQGSWVQPVKRHLFSVFPLLLLSTLLVLFLIPQWSLYEKMASALPNWGNKWFFYGRNVAVLLISFGLAWMYIKESLKGDNIWKRNLFAVLYIISYATGQSLIAFDWIMPLEYPWISTLFGGFFFIESMYMGVIISAFVCFFLYKKAGEKGPSKALEKAQYDTGVLMFGFGILWCYLFFSQLIPIWYGNMLHETIFILKRFWGMTAGSVSPWLPVSLAVIIIMFLLPFTVLQFRKSKKTPMILVPVGAIILCGFLVERFLFIKPAADISVLAMVLEFLLIAILFVMVIKTKAGLSLVESTEGKSEE